jgi:hypothetical protein
VEKKDAAYLSSKTSDNLNNVHSIPEDPCIQILPPTTKCQMNIDRSFYTARNAIKTIKQRRKTTQKVT